MKEPSWVGLIIIKNEKLLMLREIGKNYFVLPGGKAKKDEKLIEALKREIKEELGIHVKWPRLFKTYRLRAKGKRKKFTFRVYKAKTSEKFVLGDNIKEMNWIDSNYKKIRIKLGAITTSGLIDELVENGLIN